MNELSLHFRMALRRRSACLLVVLFAAVATVFLLAYPRLIADTQARLEEAYAAIPVSGWIMNAASYEEPILLEETYQAIVDTGALGDYTSYTIATLQSWAREELLANCQAESLEDPALLEKFIAYTDRERPLAWEMYALSRWDAHDRFSRLCDQVQWAEGYSAACLSGEEKLCVLGSGWGYEPGDTIPVQMYPNYRTKRVNAPGSRVVTQLLVAGVYDSKDDLRGAYCPQGMIRRLCREQSMAFEVNSLLFTMADNRQLPAFKQALLAMGLGEKGGAVRVSIDDRILEGTAAPIRSNLSLLKGLYVFFFLVVLAMGFLLCFLLARGRKPEYAVMRLLGESTAQVTCKALLEQMLLCLAGIVLGACLLLMAGQSPKLAACGIILVCYTLGAAAAVLLTVRVNVMEILRDKE